MQEQEKSELITCRAKVFPLLHLPWTRITAFAAVQEFKFQLFKPFSKYYHWRDYFSSLVATRLLAYSYVLWMLRWITM